MVRNSENSSAPLPRDDSQAGVVVVFIFDTGIGYPW